MVALHPRPFVIAVTGAAVFAACTVASSFALQWVIDEVIVPTFDEGAADGAAFAIGATLIIGIGLLRAVGVVFRRTYAGITAWRIAETYTNGVVDRLTRQPVSWHRRRADGDLVARAGVDTESAIAVLNPIPFATGTVIMVAISVVWLFTIDPVMGAIACVTFPLLVATNIVYERAVTVYFSQAQRQLGDFSAGVHESFEGVQLVKSYGAEERETRRLAELAEDVRISRVRAVRLRSWFEAALDLIPALTNIVLVIVGMLAVDAGTVTVGEFTSVVFLFTLLVFPLRLIGYALSELPRSMAAWTRIREVLDEPLEPDPRVAVGRSDDGLGVQLDGVSFRYVGDDRDALRDVDLAIPLGTVTAVVGPTGSGKSTLTELVAGLVPPTSGTVRLAADTGDPIIVFQEPFLMAGTVRENVTMGADFGDDEIWAALRVAAADQFVQRLPQGLDTVVGERGISLSGGQRQRVALARAIVRRPSLLVLDDTTSALDPRTEADVLDGIGDVLGTSTVLMVASRPSTIALADDVVMVVGGEVTGHGTHDELVGGHAGYRQLMEAFESDRSPTGVERVEAVQP
jgi:ABC-type multidrug transport system fused ATPase/permease subunit